MEVQDRLYASPNQVAKRLGHGASFWAKVFDAGLVKGYTVGRRHRKILVGEMDMATGEVTPGSALEYLEERSQKPEVVTPQGNLGRVNVGALMDQFHRAQKKARS